jgi:hypothetical protein
MMRLGSRETLKKSRGGHQATVPGEWRLLAGDLPWPTVPLSGP